MTIKDIKYELQNILSGKSISSYDAPIQTITNYLNTGNRASPVAEEKHQNKSKETEKLRKFARENNWIYEDINPSNFISRGAEQKVYIKDAYNVIKLNDSIYYASWQDYFITFYSIIIFLLTLPISY